MKFNKIMLATVALASVAVAAIAQTYSTDGDNRYYTVSRGRLDATTTPADRAFLDSRSDVSVGYKCGTVTSTSLVWKLADGTVVSTTGPVACDSTQRWTTNNGPQFAQSVSVSPTTAVSTTAGGVSATVIETNRVNR
jgi:uncharacterized protein YcfJ